MLCCVCVCVQCGVPVFVISYNVVADLTTFADPERKVRVCARAAVFVIRIFPRRAQYQPIKS